MKSVTVALTAMLLFCACSNEIYRDGKDGVPGATGPQGPVGSPGQDGKSCSVTQLPSNAGALILCEDGTSVVVTNGTNGADGADGANGTDGSNGLNGQDGATGSQGEAGAQGPAGQNATPVVMQQLCPGVNSAFPEQAFVLGGKLYAVYSSGGNASLAVLTPGTYTTTAPGQNCTFTVAADGVTVTH
jgi:hypothetical protein